MLFENLKNPISKFFVVTPLLYAVYLVIQCPCEILLKCHEKEFTVAIISSLALSWFYIKNNISM